MPTSIAYGHLQRSYHSDAPAAPGVFVLYEGPEIIYVGKAEEGRSTIRSRLHSHLRGDEGECTRSANYFSSRIKRDEDDLDVLVKDMLGNFEWHHSRLPRCNEQKT